MGLNLTNLHLSPTGQMAALKYIHQFSIHHRSVCALSQSTGGLKGLKFTNGEMATLEYVHIGNGAADTAISIHSLCFGLIGPSSVQRTLQHIFMQTTCTSTT